MPIYRYTHSCGYSHEQFLRRDRDSLVLTCERCGRGVTARQVRDNSAVITEKNEVRGVYQRNRGQRGNA